MVNFILSFCKITAASRIFSRNFYLPLLKPLTPKDALRTFRITGKWLLGSKIQHYIPVLLNHRSKKPKNAKNYGKIVHKPNEDFTYLHPVFDMENESHQLLLKVLNEKKADGNFVYTVEDKKCNIILTGQFELAIRDGDIIDILVAQRNDKILVKLKDFKKVGIEMDCFETNGIVLLMGEGATGPEEEKFHHHGKFTMSIAKIFEDKEREQEEWELELKKLINRKKKQVGEGTKEWDELIQVTMKTFDLGKFEKDAKRVVDQVAEPIVEYQIGMKVENLEKTTKVPEVLQKYGLHILPTLAEVPQIINCMSNAKLHEIEAEIELEVLEDGILLKKNMLHKISGVLVTLENGQERFVSGQMVKTEDGDVFVPGQTVETEFGMEYSPGFTVNLEGKPTLIKGLIVGEENKQQPVFVPTDSTITAEGHLSFATTKEERVLYKPKKRPFHKEKKIFIEAPEEEETNGVEEINQENIAQEEEKPKPKKIRKKKKTKKQPESNIKIEEVPPTPLLELESIFLEFKVEDEPKTEESLEVNENTDNEGSFSLDQRQEWEQLLKELMDDGLEDIIASIENKKASLQQKLEALRQLKVSLGDESITYVSLEDAQDISALLTTNKAYVGTLSEILVTLTRRVATLRERCSINPDNVDNPSKVSPPGTYKSDFDMKFDSSSNKVKVALKAATVAANELLKARPKDQIGALMAMKTSLVKYLTNDTLIEELCDLMGTSLERNEICSSVFRELTQKMKESKIATLKSAVGIYETKRDTDEIVGKLEQILERDGDLTGPAFSKLCKNDSKFLDGFINIIKVKANRQKTEEAVLECVKETIVKIVKDNSFKNLLGFVQTANDEEMKEFLQEAVAISKALGLNEVSENLLKCKSLKENILDKHSQSLLQRLTIMRQLAEKDHSLKAGLYRVRKNPDCGRTDPRIRQLVKESGVLISEASPLKNSKELPLQFLKTGNILAIEDYLVQRLQHDGPVLITKKGLQAIVPKEASSSVLAGRVPYLLIDETGISNFKPKHLIGALSMVQNRKKSFDDYVGAYDRENRSMSPFLSSSRGSSPLSADYKSGIRKSLANSRMVA